MTLGKSLSFGLLCASLTALASGACDSSEGTTARCVTGAEACPCYPNGTCNEGLSCHSKLCVEDATTVPAGGSGQGGDSSRGGAPSQGGTATSVAQGGTSAVGAGGATAMDAGGTSSGGSVGVGGTTVGFGGALASNGGSTVTNGGATVNQLGRNLVANGDFSLGAEYWHVTGSGGYELTTGSATAEGVYCVNVSSSYSSQVIGWPIVAANAITLTPSTQYFFSFRITANAAAVSPSVQPKVGYFASPYTSVFQPLAATTLSGNWQELRFTFTPTASVTAPVGIALTLTGFNSGQVCIDDVVLAEVLG